MNELLQKLMNEVGLSQEQAHKSVDAVKDFIKSKIPPAFSGAVENFLNSDAVNNVKEQAGEAADKAKAMMHEAADKADDVADVVKEKLGHLGAEAKEELGEAKDKAEDIAKDALDKLKGLFGGNKNDQQA